MKRLALIFLAAACCTAPIKPKAKGQECVSYCGILFAGVPNGAMSCDQLQTAEDESRKLWDKKLCKQDSRFCMANSCAPLFGWQIHTEDAEALLFYDGNEVVGPFVGLSRLGSKEMYLAKSADWKHGSFPHEIVHVIQNGDYHGWRESKLDAMHGGGHNGWTAHGVFRAIDELRK